MNVESAYYCIRCGGTIQKKDFVVRPHQGRGGSVAAPGSQHFACYRCGSTNPAGAVVCVNCHEYYYYVCPYCNNWVGKYLSHCPVCLTEMRPQANYNPYQIRELGQNKPQKKRVLGTILSVLLSGAVLIVGLDFLLNKPISSIVSESQPAANASQQVSETSTGRWAVSGSTLSPAPDTTPTPVSTITDPSISVAGQDIEVEYILPSSSMDSGSGSSSTKYVDTYLQEKFSTWGHCSGGSCKSSCGY
ncbi:MAG: hypothetical protein JXA01_03160 [Dehalococcoidia bacterium]|nr:hypothetical protein [Dehalococcoidia bacterium]